MCVYTVNYILVDYLIFSLFQSVCDCLWMDLSTWGALCPDISPADEVDPRRVDLLSPALLASAFLCGADCSAASRLPTSSRNGLSSLASSGKPTVSPIVFRLWRDKRSEFVTWTYFQRRVDQPSAAQRAFNVSFLLHPRDLFVAVGRDST